MSYFKYKSLDELKHFLDIIANNRLYAARYSELNDPMEGSYLTNEKNKSLIHAMRMKKDKTRILSLTIQDRNWLMWSHYANGHSGCCIEVDLLPHSSLQVKRVNYIQNVVELSEIISGEELLSNKSEIWDYENEVRVFTKSSYVQVVIKGITFGCRVSNKDFKLLKRLVLSFHPELETSVCRISKTDLYEGF